MLYSLIQTRRGKDTGTMTDQLPKVNDKKKQLLSSQRKGIKGKAVKYTIIKAGEGGEKYKHKPYSEAWRSGGYEQRPKRIRKK